MEETLAPRVTISSPVQETKALVAIVVRLYEVNTIRRAVQEAKAPDAMDVTSIGMVTSLRELQSAKALAPIEVM
jgi:hypothetical protein